MTRGFRIGTVRDVDVVIDGALLAVSIPIAWMFTRATAVALPWLARPVVALLGTAASAVVVALVVLHAVVWALATRALGTELRRVLVLPVGALVDAEADALRPADELTAFGLASLVTSCVGLVGCVVVTFVADPVVVTLASWTTLAAGAVVLASALPGYPLAGGRMVRSLATALGASVERATRATALAGGAIGLAAIGAGLLLALSSSAGGARVASGAVVALLGWAVARAAARGHERVLDELLAATWRARARGRGERWAA